MKQWISFHLRAIDGCVACISAVWSQCGALVVAVRHNVIEPLPTQA
jgi:hypothetical protein